MYSRTWSRKSLAICLAVAVLTVSSMVALATPGQQGQTGPSGELSVSGQVTVNGQNAISGATIFSGSTLNTAANSSAVVSLGKLGRVELLPGSSVKLSFDESNITGMLDAGRVRVSTPAGTSATITTKDGSVVADNSQASVFMVDVECGNTMVATQAGLVNLNSNGQAKQVAAGTQDTAGQAAPGTRCTRLTRPDTFGSLSGGGLAALLLAAGGAVAAAFWAATRGNNDINFGGDVLVVSPTK